MSRKLPTIAFNQCPSHIRQQTCRGPFTNAINGLQQIGLLFEFGMLLEMGVKALLQGFDLLPNAPQRLVD